MSQNKAKDYKESLLEILDQNYNFDSFFLAEISFKLKKSQNRSSQQS